MCYHCRGPPSPPQRERLKYLSFSFIHKGMPSTTKPQEHMFQNSRKVIFAKKKLPAAPGKTSTELMHVIKSQERQFCLQKISACGSREDPNRANTCHKILRTSFLRKKNPCGSREDLNRANTCYKIPGTSVLPEKKSACGSREDLNRATPPQNGKVK